MAQKTATGKDMFLQALERESATTKKVLRALPPDRADFSPAAPMKSAKDLAWVIVSGEGIIERLLAREFAPAGHVTAPATLHEVIATYEDRHQDIEEKLRSWDEADLERTVRFPVAPGKMGDVRKIDLCWFVLMDQIHHRGQLTVYLRMLGAKVPSVYGPTADEPWT
jgi:uncharacterized damage-inducible protein DinB